MTESARPDQQLPPVGVGLLPTAAKDARDLLSAAEANWAAPIVHCPAWDAEGLVRHVGGIFAWMAATVRSGKRADRAELGPVPEDAAGLPTWYLGGLDAVLQTLREADEEREVWNFSATGAEPHVGWWRRRLPVEVAVHRWDAQYGRTTADPTAPPAEALDGEVASAGIGEYLIHFLPRLLAQDGLEDWTGTLHLHATDGEVEWLVDLGAGGVAVPGHAKADTAIRATRSDLLLWLHNRATAEPVQVFGDEAVLGHWKQLQR
ncbi:MAG: maleylpyruvate isomerase N-terminal domain-containing protein [Acidimicrobiaceae bacterium]|nr:maleylpyruvate isomerase N-terminal domain-containing protein [Acidimicrobiaceae bacterium]